MNGVLEPLLQGKAKTPFIPDEMEPVVSVTVSNSNPVQLVIDQTASQTRPRPRPLSIQRKGKHMPLASMLR